MADYFTGGSSYFLTLAEYAMKFRTHLDTDDYLIIVLLLIGVVIAAVGVYSIGMKFLQWLGSALSQINIQ